MKGKLLVVFKSLHGYVKRYVDILGNELGCDAVPADKLKGEMLIGYDKVLYIGSMRGTQINGFRKFAEYLDAIFKKLVVCGVGMLPAAGGRAEAVKDGTISVVYEKFIPVFYAQGGFDMSELTRAERMSVSMTVRQIKLGSVISDDEMFVINAAATPIDEVKKSNIQPLIDYLDGKPVSDKLYSPPEITDPDEINKFFAERDGAEKAPDDRARELKKKLRM